MSSVVLQGAHGLPEMRNLPEGYQEIEHAKTCDRAAHPAGRDCVLQAAQAGLVGGIDKEKIVRPVAQPERVKPWQEGEHNAHFQTQDDVEQYRQLR